MSYTQYPAVVRAGVPGATDDRSEGFIVGCQWINSLTAPRDLYICTDSTVGAATWASASSGGVSSHPALSTLGWSASGHTGTSNSVACFNGAGAALNVQATVEGTVLTFTGGVLTFASFAATVAYLSDKAIEVNYNIGFTDAASSAFVLAGTMV
jgi:hypothetical protein